MPANLTPQFMAAEEAYKRATAPEEMLAALEEMLRQIPKHKGTEKMQADIKRRIARAREAGEASRKKGRVDPYRVEKEGAGQVFVVGPPNSGKSALVGALTSARVVVTDYPFATSGPVPGMMRHENVLIQLVDTPPFTTDNFPPAMAASFRNGDGLLLVIDASSDDCLEKLDESWSLLESGKALAEGKFLKVIASKADAPAAADNVGFLRETFPQLCIIDVSIRDGTNLANLPELLFHALGVIRAYSKPPGKQPDKNSPFVLKAGSTVEHMAEAIHRDLPRTMKGARVWGSAKFDGQSVPREHILADGDIVEFRT